METDAFQRRLNAMQTSTVREHGEIDAAVMIYERLKTARAICESHGLDGQSGLLAVFSELCAEARSGHGSMTRE